jgi:vacuolar protein sorting-associated protein 53
LKVQTRELRVAARMNGMAQDTSPLSSADYDPISDLNQIFPDPSSLSMLAAVQMQLSTHLEQLDNQVKVATLKQRQQQSATREQIAELQTGLEDLFKDVETVKEKAKRADEVMSRLTGAIRRLDRGKHNLTISMTALKRLQMLSISTFVYRGMAYEFSGGV